MAACPTRGSGCNAALLARVARHSLPALLPAAQSVPACFTYYATQRPFSRATAGAVRLPSLDALALRSALVWDGVCLLGAWLRAGSVLWRRECGSALVMARAACAREAAGRIRLCGSQHHCPCWHRLGSSGCAREALV